MQTLTPNLPAPSTATRLRRLIAPVRRAEDARFLFLVGAMKAGTTSLHNSLAAHPMIHAGREKEPNFFSEGDSNVETMDEYLALWPRACWRRPEQGWLLDSSPSYSKYPNFGDAAEAIAAATRCRRILYVMRDPVDRIESQIRHIVGRKPENAKRLMPMCTIPGRMKRHIIDCSRYAAQIERYRLHFSDREICLLTFDDLIAESEATLGHIWAFLDLPPAPATLPHRNQTQRPADAGLLTLTPEVRAALRDELADDMARLRDVHGIDVARWGYR